jgi:hypothetical protein
VRDASLFPRLGQLVDCLNPISEGDDFFDFWASLESNSVKRKMFMEIETHLSKVSSEVWIQALPEISKKFKKRSGRRGWQDAFDALRECICMSYLLDLGFDRICFVPRSTVRTPDIQAVFRGEICGIEVKSINRSDDEIERRKSSGPGSAGLRLSPLFFSKLASTLETAGNQLRQFKCRKGIVFTFLEFDDSLNEYVASNLSQISEWLRTQTMRADQYYFVAPPAYYGSTTRDGPWHIVSWPEGGFPIASG